MWGVCKGTLLHLWWFEDWLFWPHTGIKIRPRKQWCSVSSYRSWQVCTKMKRHSPNALMFMPWDSTKSMSNPKEVPSTTCPSMITMVKTSVVVIRCLSTHPWNLNDVCSTKFMFIYDHHGMVKISLVAIGCLHPSINPAQKGKKMYIQCGEKNTNSVGGI